MAKPKGLKQDHIALVLQGGGALGAYQVGVFEALAERGYTPDWVAGTSIGAINGAIIAGNPPERRVERLKQFWQEIAHIMPYHGNGFPMPPHSDSLLSMGSLMNTMRAITFGQQNFFQPRMNLHFSQAPEHLSFYDTTPLRRTLERVVDFDYLNNDDVRLTVGAVSVTRGEIEYFDSGKIRMGPEHIMASGALPPGFPPVRINGELYWDGGVYSNTPLEAVLDRLPQGHALCFMVNLWCGHGREPSSMADVLTREKEIRYASRFHREIDAFRERQDLRRAVHMLYQELPEEKRNHPELAKFSERGCHTDVHIVRLGQRAESWEPPSKDVDFEAFTVRERWAHGYDDAGQMIARAPWQASSHPHTGVILHDLNEEDRAGPGSLSRDKRCPHEESGPAPRQPNRRTGKRRS